MGSLQQVVLGGVCVVGAFLMGHYLNHQEPSATPFEQKGIASPSSEPSTSEQREMNSMLPNFRTQSKLGIDFDKQADLPPPSNLEQPSLNDNLRPADAVSGADSSHAAELDIEVPDFSTLAAQFKGTALELPSIDSAPLLNQPESFQPDVQPNATVKSAISSITLGSGLSQTPPESLNGRTDQTIDGTVLIPQFKTSINPLEGMDEVEQNPSSNPAVLPATETAFRAEDFMPKLRSDSVSTPAVAPDQHQDPHEVGLFDQPAEYSADILPPASVSREGNSVLEFEQSSAGPMENRVATSYAHPNAVVSYNDPFPTEVKGADAKMGLSSPNHQSKMSSDPSSASDAPDHFKSEAGSNRWLARGHRQDLPADPDNRLDSVQPNRQDFESARIPFGLRESERNRLSRLNLGSSLATDPSATRFEVYQTRQGDSLQAISSRFYGTPDFYLDIYLTNRKQLRNPSDVPAGITLRIPIYE